MKFAQPLGFARQTDIVFAGNKRLRPVDAEKIYCRKRRADFDGAMVFFAFQSDVGTILLGNDLGRRWGGRDKAPVNRNRCVSARRQTSLQHRDSDRRKVVVAVRRRRSYRKVGIRERHTVAERGRGPGLGKTKQMVELENSQKSPTRPFWTTAQRRIKRKEG